MQVSQKSDAITHAVIGSAETVEMGMSDDSAHLMHLFSTALYTHPRLATVREIMCNGWDGNIVAGNTHIPLEVTITDTQLMIKDSGPGIPHDQIGKIYGTYGNSTKRDDQTVTGGFGLGSKAPFAYTDNFEVISCFAGVKTIYRVSKSSMEKGGKPAINKIVAVPTEETGVTVTITLRENHRTEFTELVKEVATLGDILVSINGNEPIKTLPLLESPTGYIINSFKGTNLARINVRYGNVVYPVPRKEEYAAEWDHVNSGMCRLWESANIIFYCEPDSVSIQPSREALILTETTMQTVKDALSKFSPKELARATYTVEQFNKERINTTIRNMPTDKVLPGIGNEVVLDEFAGNLQGTMHWSGVYAFTVRQAAINHTVRSVRWRANEEETQIKRIKHLIANGNLPSNDIKMAKALIKAYYKDKKASRISYVRGCGHMAAVIQRYRVQELKQIVNSGEHISADRLFLPILKNQTYGVFTAAGTGRLHIRNPADAYHYLEKRIVISTSKSAVKDWLNYEAPTRTGAYDPWFMYIIQVNPKNHADVIKSFEDAGWKVDQVGLEPRERATRLVAEVDPNAPPKVVAPKRTGYLTLKSSYFAGEFTLVRARKASKPEDTIKKPVAWTYLKTENEGATDIPEFTGRETRAILNMWGDQVAVIASSSQANALIKKGVPDLKSFVYEYADKKLAESTDFPRYLAFIRPIVESDKDKGANRVLTKMLAHPSLMADLGLRFSLSVETKMLVTFFDSQAGNTTRYENQMVPVMPLCEALASKVKRHPLSRSLPVKMQDSPWAEFINMSTLAIHLDCHLPDSPHTKVPYEIVRKLLS